MKLAASRLRFGLRLVLYGLAMLALLLPVILLLMRWTGERRWELANSELKTAGGSLNRASLPPRPIPAAENFAALELLSGIAMSSGPSAAAQEAQEKRQRIERACQFLRQVQAGQDSGEAFVSARGVDVQALARAHQASGLLAWPEGAAADAAGLRLALEKQAPFLSELGRAAGQRAHAEFLPRPMERSVQAPEEDWPHWEAVLGLQELLGLHAAACLAEGDAMVASQQALAQLRLVEAMFRESRWGPLEIGLWLMKDVLQTVWALHRSGLLHELQLEQLQKALGAMDLDHVFLQTTFHELAAALQNSVCEVASDGLAFEAVFRRLLHPNTVRSGWDSVFGVRLRSAFLEDHLRWLIRPLRETGLQPLWVQTEERKRWVSQGAASVVGRTERMLSKWVLLEVNEQVVPAAFVETLRRQAVLACALERHRLRHEAYPTALAELSIKVPTACLKAVDGKPMRYRRSGDGRYRLWSDGLDGRDDDGAFHVELNPEGEAPPPDNERYRGDWVWRYESALAF